MTARPHLTVALCTWNRAALLERTLAALTQLRDPGEPWELVVVDNGSVDRTPALLVSFAERLPLRVVHEPEAGLSHARNAAVRHASGDYIVWTDDDVLVDPDWLAAYVRAFRRWPEASVFGGPITGGFEGASPSWLGDALPVVHNAWALLDLGDEPVALGGDLLPFGANYAVRMDAQRRRAYDPRLGRCRAMLRGGEEAELLHALLRDGVHGRWVPEARVRHIIPASRQTLAYLRAYYRGNVPWDPACFAPSEREVFGRPLWIWREAVAQEVLFQLTRFAAPPAVWAQHLRRASSAWGLLDAYPARRAVRPSLERTEACLRFE